MFFNFGLVYNQTGKYTADTSQGFSIRLNDEVRTCELFYVENL